MILTGQEICAQVRRGRIRIAPFAEENATTNSYDLRLGSRILRYKDEPLDPRVENASELIDISGGICLEQGEFVLAETHESLGSDHFVPLIHGRSGTARLGLFAHITADLFDLGYHGRSTLQLYATLPVRLYPLMKIAQVTFWVPKGEITLYDGKYQGGDGPQASKAYRDFSRSTEPPT